MGTPIAQDAPPSGGLELARRLEEAASEAASVRSLYRDGPARRHRRKARRQLRRLLRTLEQAQRVALGEALPEDVRAGVVACLERLDPVLHAALHTVPTRSDLKLLRRRLKAERRGLEDLLQAGLVPPPEAPPDPGEA